MRRDGADRPIGVFDSGVGGLTVVREITQLLPNESVVYFGDTARVPYGPKSGETVRRYAREASSLLVSREVKLVVIACNTATAYACEMLDSELEVPVIGVIRPGARAAVAATRSGRIGVLGTAGTIGSGVYDLEVRRMLPEARVYAQPCPLFVPLVEEGKVDHAATRVIAEEYLHPLHEMDVDVVILGCTHYPLLRPLLQEILGPGVTLVDSGAETAKEVRESLDRAGLLRSGDSPPTYEFYASDSPLRFREVGRRFVGELIRSVEYHDADGRVA